MYKQIIQTDKSPKAIGPYSQAIKTGNLVFVSGQLPSDPATGQIQGDIQAQTRQSLENIRSILAAAGATLNDVVKTTVFLKNLDDFNSMNEIYAQYFTENPPARSTVEVSRVPRGALIEIEVLAVSGNDSDSGKG